MQKKALIIGAGVGGLATSVYLSQKGYLVEVYEANTYYGGKLAEISGNGYRFDAGPSLFTMPEKLLDVIGENAGFEFERLQEICRYFYEDGTVIKGWAHPEEFANEAHVQTGEPKENILNFLKKSAFIYDTTAHLFLEKSLHKSSSYFNLKTAKSLLKLPFIGTQTSMNSVNEKSFVSDKLTQLFNRYATYNGSNPYVAPATLNIIPHLEFNQGAFFPKNGMRAIADSIYEKALSLGVQFHFEEKVHRIDVVGNKVTGINVGGKLVSGDLVVSNMDIVPTYKKLLPDQIQPKKVLEQERSSSALIFYWGVQQTFPNLELHNIFFSEDYRAEFDHIFHQKSICFDPTVYVHISSKMKQDDAPNGCENWFVMINVPGDTGQDWDALIAKARTNILTKLSRILKTDLAQIIDFESILDPKGIESKTSSFQGSLYGSASNDKMAAFFRHPNFSNRIDNLYFVGGSVHPGGGIPLALSSAKIVNDLVDAVN